MRKARIDRARINLSRRRMCVGAAAACAQLACLGMAPRAHAQGVAADHGRVIPPLPVPAVPVRCADGSSASLAALVQGRATALHLMFTGCSTVCPIQGAIFQRVQSLLPDQGEQGIQLLSLSIDPVGDSPAAMRNWLRRFDARAGWIAVAPEARDLDTLLDLFGQGRNAVESHATQVNIISRRGELIWRTPQLPSADSIADILRKV
jgi:protein SCO1/2